MFLAAAPLLLLATLGASTRLGPRDPSAVRVGRPLATIGWAGVDRAARRRRVAAPAPGLPSPSRRRDRRGGHARWSGSRCWRPVTGCRAAALLVAALVLVVPAPWSAAAFGVGVGGRGRRPAPRPTAAAADDGTARMTPTTRSPTSAATRRRRSRSSSCSAAGGATGTRSRRTIERETGRTLRPGDPLHGARAARASAASSRRCRPSDRRQPYRLTERGRRCSPRSSTRLQALAARGLRAARRPVDGGSRSLTARGQPPAGPPPRPGLGHRRRVEELVEALGRRCPARARARGSCGRT